MSGLCVEVGWYGDGCFSAVTGSLQDWDRVLAHAAAIRLLGEVPLQGWDAVYEVDMVTDPPNGAGEWIALPLTTRRYLVEASTAT